MTYELPEAAATTVFAIDIFDHTVGTDETTQSATIARERRTILLTDARGQLARRVAFNRFVGRLPQTLGAFLAEPAQGSLLALQLSVNEATLALPAIESCVAPPDALGASFCEGVEAARSAVQQVRDAIPDPDEDHDGVPNEADQCPALPETINGNADDDGCPDSAPRGASVVQVTQSSNGSRAHLVLTPQGQLRFANDQPDSDALLHLRQIARALIATTLFRHDQYVLRLGSGGPSGDPPAANLLARRAAVRDQLRGLGVLEWVLTEDIGAPFERTLDQPSDGVDLGGGVLLERRDPGWVGPVTALTGPPMIGGRLPGAVRVSLTALLGTMTQAASSAAEREDVCQTAGILDWLQQPDRVQRLVHFEVAATRASELRSVDYDVASLSADYLAFNHPQAILVQRVPTGTSLTFEVTRQEATDRDAATVIAQFALSLAQGVVRGAGQATVLQTIIQQLCRDSRVNIDAESSALAPLGTRAFVVRSLEAGYRTEVRVCRGSPCSTSGAGNNLNTTVSLTPRPRLSFAVLVDLGAFAGFDLTGRRAGQDAFITPTYQAIGSAQGPEQLYQLQGTRRIVDHFGFSVLLALRWDRFLFGIGPTLLDGTGFSPLVQWNTRFGISFARNFYFTFGAGLRATQRPVGVDLDQIVAVPVTNGASMAPSFGRNDQLAMVFGIGLSMDLAAIPDTASDLLKAIRGR